MVWFNKYRTCGSDHYLSVVIDSDLTIVIGLLEFSLPLDPLFGHKGAVYISVLRLERAAAVYESKTCPCI